MPTFSGSLKRCSFGRNGFLQPLYYLLPVFQEDGCRKIIPFLKEPC